MDFSFHSQRFDAAQLSADQEDSKPGPSQPQTANITLTPPLNYRCTADDWARWASQQVFTSPRYAEPYGVGPLSQDPLGYPNGYLDSYHSHVTHPMAGTSVEALAPQEADAPLDWALLDSSHAFKDPQYSCPVHLNPLQPPQNSPPSPFSEVSSYHSPQSLADMSPSMTAHTADRPSPRPSPSEHKEERPGHLPYSALIYQALKDAPGNKLPLQGIYSWFEANTDKGADPNAKGWQNSIRHNLSMNAGFEAVKEEVEPGRKTINFWRLTPEAIQSGCIQSTTRYRKLQNQKKALNSSSRALQRQQSGSRGNHTTRVVKSRHPNSPLGERADHQQQTNGSNSIIGHHYIPSALPSVQPYMQRPQGVIVGCTAMLPPSNPVFLDAAEQGPSFTIGTGYGWCATNAGLGRVHDSSEHPGRSVVWQGHNSN